MKTRVLSRRASLLGNIRDYTAFSWNNGDRLPTACDGLRKATVTSLLPHVEHFRCLIRSITGKSSPSLSRVRTKLMRACRRHAHTPNSVIVRIVNVRKFGVVRLWIAGV